MKRSEKPGVERAKYLIGFVILAAAVLLGATAYFGANSARGTVGKIGNALDGVGAGVPSLNGSAGIPEGQMPATAAAGQPNNSTAPGANGSAQQPASLAQNGTAPSAQEAQQNATAVAKKEVTIDFLYADWCPHCQAMKPIVAALAARLPAGRLEVRYWDEADRSKNATVAGVYADYTSKGYFQGFPTFVANWDDYRVGEMSEPAFDAWVCSKFSAPKPAGC